MQHDNGIIDTGLRTAERVCAAPFRARFIGEFALSNADGVDQLPHARKARALIAYLISAEGRPVARHKLISLGWGDRGEEQARASLRQALYDSRLLSAIDKPLLHLDRSHVRVDPTQCETDVARLLKLAAIDDVAGLAAALPERPEPYLADLDGISSAIDEWLEGERPRWQEQLVDAVRNAAERALAGGDVTHARRLTAFLIDGDPFDEALVRLAMLCRQASGDRAAVHRLFDRLQEGLRREMNVAPEAETLAIYRKIISETGQGDASPTPNPRSTDAPLTHQSVTALLPVSRKGAPVATVEPRGRSQRRLFAGATAALLATVAVGWWLVLPTPSPTVQTVAVELLQTPKNDLGADAMRSGLADDLARAVGALPDGFTIGQSGDDDFDPHSAQLILSGSASTIGETLHARLRLHDQVAGALLWSKDHDGPLNQPGVLRDQIVTRTAIVLRCALSNRHSGSQRIGVVVERLYLQACDALTDDDLNRAVTLLREVTIIAPRYARAWADLALSEAYLGCECGSASDPVSYRRANAAARNALALDASLGSAYAALARAQTGIAKWPARMALVERGLTADPESSELHAIKGELLDTVGRWHEGLVAHQQAFDLEPLNHLRVTELGTALALHGKLDEAEALLTPAERRFPHNMIIWNTRFMIELRLGDPRRALAMLDDAKRPEHRSEESASNFKLLVNARLYPKSTVVDAALNKAWGTADAAYDPLVRAHFLAALGRMNQAFRAALEDKGPLYESANEMLFRSYMKPFRDDPRFMVVARRRGLLAIWQATGRWPDFCASVERTYDCRAAAQAAMQGPPPAGFAI